MKSLISQELQRKGMADNIKLGPGGIREIEFIVQAFQLVRGGRQSALQQRPVLTVLAALMSLAACGGDPVDPEAAGEAARERETSTPHPASAAAIVSGVAGRAVPPVKMPRAS